ncbi:MAG: hypothetical protein ACHQFZ_10615 [Acidimicrobiales bacterium]
MIAKMIAARRSADSESGAILILALAFIIVVSVTVAALSTWALNSLNNTTKFNSARALDYAAGGATQIAIQSMRYTPLVGTVQSPGYTLNASPPSYCWGNGPKSTAPAINGITISVFCTTIENLASSSTRVVTFYACRSSGAAAAAAAAACVTTPVLQSQVSYNDYPPGGGVTLKNTCTQTCGEGANLLQWDWGPGSSSTVGTIPNTITVTSSAPGNATIGGATYTPVATATSGDLVVVTSATSAVCTFISGVVSFVGQGTCTLNFNDSGNGTYAAAPQVQQTFNVGKGTAVITVTSSAPANATIGGPTYVPSATSTSSDTVAITSGTTSVCTIASGIVSFAAAGTCTLNFNDPGNSSYSAATQVQQSFSVTSQTSGSYTGSSNGNLPNTNTYYAINALNSNGSSTSTANAVTPGVAETLTSLSFTMNTTSGTDHTATVGLIAAGVWSPTALTCTITGGSGQTLCTITASVTVPVGDSINIRAIGNGNHTGQWTTNYTQP